MTGSARAVEITPRRRRHGARYRYILSMVSTFLYGLEGLAVLGKRLLEVYGTVEVVKAGGQWI